MINRNSSFSKEEKIKKNDKESKKYIKKLIRNEKQKLQKTNNIYKNKKSNININNINNDMDINDNIHLNSNKSKDNISSLSRNIFVRKILTEEKYIIDEKGKERILEINKSILCNNSENFMKNKPLNIKEKYNQKNPKIIVITNNNNIRHNLNCYNRNNKISENNYLIKSKTPSNINIKNNNIYKINRIKKNDSNKHKELDIFYNNNYSFTNPIFNLKYQNRNNNNSKLIKTQTSQNHILPNHKITYININDKINNNHSYHEIKKIKRKKKNLDSMTIYHDYSNKGKEIIFNNSFQNIKIISKNKKIINPKMVNRSNSNSYIQIPNSLIKNNIESNLNKNKIISRNENHKSEDIYFYNRNNNVNNSYILNSYIDKRYYY